MIHPLDATPMQLREELAIVWALIEQEKECSRELEQQLAEREKQIVELISALEKIETYGCRTSYAIATEALAATEPK